MLIRPQNLIGLLLVLGVTIVQPTGTIAAPRVATAQTVYEATGTANGLPFRVRLLELRRSGNRVIARFRFTNTADNQFQLLFLQTALAQNPEPNNPQNPDYNTISGVYAVDTNAQDGTKYEVIRDRNNRPLCSRVETAIAPNKPIELVAQFAVPSAVNRLTVHFPTTTAFIDVPILPPRR